jgi:hypothetical protein
MESTYEYAQLPLTPAVIESLTLELFAGQIAERQTIVQEVLRVHRARGGKSSDSQNPTGSVKKVLSNMLKKGLADNPSTGHWRIRGEGLQATQSIEASSDYESLLEGDGNERNCEEKDTSPPVLAEISIGTGNGAVYVYYLPTYRQHAEHRGESVWPCKIGRTDRDPLERILTQAATALPERPIVAIVLRTSLPIAWESAIHGVLTLRGLKMKDSPGSEWFLTSPEEILQLAHTFDPSLFSQSDSAADT